MNISNLYACHHIRISCGNRSRFVGYSCGALCRLRDSQTGWHQILSQPTRISQKKTRPYFPRSDYEEQLCRELAYYPLIWISLHHLIWISFTLQFGFLLLPDLDFSPPSASAHHFWFWSITPWPHIVNWNRMYVIHLHVILEKKSFCEQARWHDQHHTPDQAWPCSSPEAFFRSATRADQTRPDFNLADLILELAFLFKHTPQAFDWQLTNTSALLFSKTYFLAADLRATFICIAFYHCIFNQVCPPCQRSI